MTAQAYYNEIEPYAVQWLRNLIRDGHIAPGVVDDRSIEDVQPSDLHGFTQCHFFAGYGMWSYALRRAGWPDDRPVWTGSCPCQPFSESGKGLGFSDPRHLWPKWRDLIAERRPAIVFGEQVAAASEWLALVRSDLEAMGYAMGAAPIEAASAGADHFRDRLWFVGHSDDAERRADHSRGDDAGRAPAGRQQDSGHAQEYGRVDLEGYLWCPDGKHRRRPPPGIRWLGDGSPTRMAQLRAIGNAIDPRPAAAFIESVMEAI